MKSIKNQTYKISEIFFSIQGEGMRVGMPMIFLRMTGCNLRCEFCDTKYSLEGGEEISLCDLLNALRKYSCKDICITGGEPFYQDIFLLCLDLKRAGYSIAVETNGMFYSDWIMRLINWVTVSPKNGIYDKRFKLIASEFKYVISRDLSLIDREIEGLVYLQPMDNDIETARWLAEIVKQKAEQYPNWRLGQQYQKLLWGNEHGK